MKYYTTFLFILFIQVFGTSQRKGVPIIKSYGVAVTSTGPHSWGVLQDGVGILYFANDDGLLTYDSETWKTYSLPNRTIVRSIARDDNGRIFVGGQNSIGYFFPNNKGELVFNDLKYTLPVKEQDFDDVWNIMCNSNIIYFTANNKIYSIDNNKGKLVRKCKRVLFFGEMNGEIVFQDEGQLFRIVDDKIVEIDLWDSLNDVQIVNIHSLSPSISLFLNSDGSAYFYEKGNFEKWEYKDEFLLSGKEVLAVKKAPNGNLLFGTRRNGLYVFSDLGEFLYKIDRKNGILGNNIISIFIDNERNTWIGTNKGINQILTSSFLSRIYPNELLDEAGYSSLLQDSVLYLGTSDGVYKNNWNRSGKYFEKDIIEKVPNTDGQVWNLLEIEDKVIMFHHSGMFELKENISKKLSPDWGSWICTSTQESTLLCGTYDGVEKYSLIENEITYEVRLDSFIESSRFIVEESIGIYWVSHPYKGVFRFSKNENADSYRIQKYGKSHGLPSVLSNYVFKVKGEVVFGTVNGVYSFDNVSNTFESHISYGKLFDKGEKIYRLIEGADNSVWFVTDNTVGYHKIIEKGLDKEIESYYIPELKDLMVGGFETINPIDEENIIVGVQNGFIHCNPAMNRYDDYQFHVSLKNVINSKKNESVFIGVYETEGVVSYDQKDSDILSFEHHENEFMFNFVATSFEYPEKVLYRSYLEGADEDWHDWNSNTTKEYTNLDPGFYTFFVVARNLKGKESTQTKFSFEIKPAWYNTILAYCIYGLFLVALLWFWYYYFSSKLTVEVEKSKLSEADVNRLEKEKLQLELDYKNRELLSASMHLDHKNEVLNEIVALFEKFKGKVEEKNLKKAIDRVSKIMRIEQQSDNVWENFVSHFNAVNPMYLERLKTRFPNLSQRDLKLCAYIKMNLSTKELASMMNMTIRGVEGARYRLRKKLTLGGDVSLTDFLYAFSIKGKENED